MTNTTKWTVCDTPERELYKANNDTQMAYTATRHTLTYIAVHNDVSLLDINIVTVPALHTAPHTARYMSPKQYFTIIV